MSTYQPRPIIMWKLKRKDVNRIACQQCKWPWARYGMTADGGAPYFYACSKCVPVGVPVEMCSNTAELIAAVKARNPRKKARR